MYVCVREEGPHPLSVAGLRVTFQTGIHMGPGTGNWGE